MRAELKPVFDQDDGTFWMSYEDFTKTFDSLNVCMLGNWQELRLKGKIISENEEVFTKWHYVLKMPRAGKIIIGIHQEDERIEGVKFQRPNLDLGIVVMKITASGYEYAGFTPPQVIRESQVILTLEEGNYLVVPVSSGCLMSKRKHKGRDAKLLTSDGYLNPEFSGTVRDIFRKYDLFAGWSLSFQEMQVLMHAIDINLTLEMYNEMLTKYRSTSDGLLP